MKDHFYVCWCWLSLLLLPTVLQASHIVGGEMTYTCLGNDRYDIALTIFRDCENGNPQAYFDNPAIVGIFNARTGNLIRTISLFLPSDDTLDLTQVNPCFTIVQDVCIHTTTYRRRLTLPYSADGYHLVYQRCCRNNVITNILQPGFTGATYETLIGPSALSSCNSSPSFQDWPPFYICQGSSIDYDNSATDIDGDSIVYGLYTPHEGGTRIYPRPTPPMGPPFNPVTWRRPYSASNMLGGSDPFRIDPQTGRLSGTPPHLGIFVVGICAKEYRNGVLIGVTRRDFQYEVVACAPLVAGFDAQVPTCNTSLSIAHINQTNNLGVDFFWDFGDGSPGLQGPSVRHTYPDTGTYTVQLIAAPGLACADTVKQVVRIDLDGADIAVSNAVACRGDTVLLVAQNSLSSYNTITNYTWSPNAVVLSGQGTDSVYVLVDNNSSSLNVTATNNNNCLDVVTSNITLEVVNANFDSLIFDCNTTLAIPFNNTSSSSFSNLGYLWDFGGTGTSSVWQPRHAFPDTGAYTITLIAGVGNLCQDTFSRDIYIPLDGATVVPTTPTYACRGDELFLGVDNPLQQYNNITNYTWSPNAPILSGQGTDSIRLIADQSIVFRLAITNDQGCTDTFILPLQVPQIDAIFEVQRPACATDLVVPFINTSIDTTYSFVWDFGGTGTSTSTQPIHTFPDTGTYTVQLVGGIGTPCQDTLERLVRVYIEGVDLTGSDAQFVCINDTAVLVVTDRWSNYNTITNYRWSPNTGIIDGQGTALIRVLAQGDQTYAVIATNNFGCSDSTTIMVNTSTLSPPLDIVAVPDSIFIGQRAQLYATEDPSYTYTWIMDTTLSRWDEASPIAMPRQATTYFLTVNNGSCINQDSITVWIRAPICGAPLIFVPNAFSPDGDGYNDELLVRGNHITSMSLVVYNRWGKKLFETNNQSQGWDGTFGGVALPPDVYGYYLQCTCDGGETALLKGNITLLK